MSLACCQLPLSTLCQAAHKSISHTAMWSTGMMWSSRVLPHRAAHPHFTCSSTSVPFLPKKALHAPQIMSCGRSTSFCITLLCFAWHTNTCTSQLCQFSSGGKNHLYWHKAHKPVWSPPHPCFLKTRFHPAFPKCCQFARLAARLLLSLKTFYLLFLAHRSHPFYLCYHPRCGLTCTPEALIQIMPTVKELQI